ncbi:MAG: FAD-dependent oxidoreductase [Candidatus Omnitrophica bacterium]|jgi:protoporphyrinogen oxidase|nr:FAD-dependent oxidoreductase [Candidatus Omnitrophota bacterium]MDD5080137.1 FAD-dependent oxidoreductase [Candidatus Omnitrophota bacterium]
MADKRIIILGAGLSGLSAAWHLQKKGIDCSVFEAQGQPGGLCRSKEVDGFVFDYCGHLLHFKHEYTFRLVKSLLGDNLHLHKRDSRIYFNSRFTPYPFQANLYGLPPAIVKECLAGFIEKGEADKRGGKNSMNFRDWIYFNFGKGIAKYFMVPYNTKFWGLPPQRITCEWLNDFIPVPSLDQVIEGAIGQSREEFGYNRQFWYPKKGGISSLARALAGQLSNLHLNSKVVAIDPGKREVGLASGRRVGYDRLISSIPLPEMPGLIRKMPAAARRPFAGLRWNSIFNLNLGIEGMDWGRKHWAYFPQPDISFFRVGFFHNFSPALAPAGKGSLYVELAHHPDSPPDTKRAITRLIKDLKNTGLLNSRANVVCRDVNRIKYAYPVYDRYYAAARKGAVDFLSSNRVIPVGRYGAWRYLSMEGALLEGKRVADLVTNHG